MEPSDAVLKICWDQELLCWCGRWRIDSHGGVVSWGEKRKGTEGRIYIWIRAEVWGMDGE